MIDTSRLRIEKTSVSKLSDIDFNNIPFGRVFSDHMYVAEYDNGAWSNMRIVPFKNFSIHPANIAWHYGQSVFEGMKATKANDGTPILFRPEKHAIRINKSAARMCMPEFPQESFMEAVYELVKLEKGWIPPQEGSALYLRPYMVAMDEFIGVQVAKSYMFCIFCCPVGPYYAKDLKLKADDTYIRAAQGGVGAAKAAGNYGASLYPASLAKQEGYDQVLWLDAKEFKYVQEVGTMNIFFAFGDKVVTPATSGTILDGITRDSCIQILKEKGIEVEERPLSIEEIMQGGKDGSLTEVFGSGTAAVIAPVKEIAYKGDVINIDTSAFKIAPMLKDTLNGIRSERLEDSFGWNVRVV
ncbi:MAG: branched-chain amino acid aminotransferase [Saprospiraceae bacterium]|nr:branched-chain amino acid aminotransferase [Saprospiraceae bacterium]